MGFISNVQKTMKTLYDILELSEDASQEKIKSQYFLMINAWHPDKFRNPEQKKFAEEKTKEINEAYTTLKDAYKRAEYDRKLNINKYHYETNIRTQSTEASYAKPPSSQYQEVKNERTGSKNSSSSFYDYKEDEFIECWNCHTQNSKDASTCRMCGKILFKIQNELKPKIYIPIRLLIFLVLGFFIFVINLCSSSLSSDKNTQSKVTINTTLPTSLPTNNPSILYENDFSMREISNEYFDDISSMSYSDDGGYIIMIKKVNSYSGLNFPISASDVRVEINADQLSGSDKDFYGLVCRVSDDNFYLFTISENGFFEIGKSINGWTTSLKSSQVSTVTWREKMNNIVGECHGPYLRLIVNKKLVAQVEDNSFSSGDVGILVGSRNDINVSVKFFDVLVTKIYE